LENKEVVMKKIVLAGFILLFMFCAKKQTTVETEGLEEVIVFGEEETTISQEPVYPVAEEEPVMPPAEEVVVAPPPVEPEAEEVPIIEPIVLEEEALVEPMVTEEVAVIPPPVEEEAAMSLPPPPPVAAEEAYAPTQTPVATPGQVYGFRIQIFASSTTEGAGRVADDARAAFSNQSVYVDHVVPYYKVRVGDCLTREEADAIRHQALNLGFVGAFIVETMITP
jgi:hypothetical protein